MMSVWHLLWIIPLSGGLGLVGSARQRSGHSGGLCHTKNPLKAKPWADPYGISGKYLMDECYLAKDGTVKRCKVDETTYDADAMPSYWETVDLETWEPPVVEE